MALGLRALLRRGRDGRYRRAQPDPAASLARHPHARARRVGRDSRRSPGARRDAPAPHNTHDRRARHAHRSVAARMAVWRVPRAACTRQPAPGLRRDPFRPIVGHLPLPHAHLHPESGPRGPGRAHSQPVSRKTDPGGRVGGRVRVARRRCGQRVAAGHRRDRAAGHRAGSPARTDAVAGSRAFPDARPTRLRARRDELSRDS